MGAKTADANGNDADSTTADDGAVKLQPKLGLINAITIVVGSIIGTLSYDSSVVGGLLLL